jgi:glycosyltransferase involved in cell wall biosynthesis
MKILITTFTYPPNKDGVAEATRVMAEGLAGLGWEVSVATQPPELRTSGSRCTIEKVNGVEVARFDLGESYPTDPGMAAEVARYQDFVRGGGFDVVVNQCWKVWPTALSVRLFHELPGAKVMVSHGYSLHTYLWARKLTLGLGVWLRGLRWTAANLPKMIRRYDRLVFLSEKRGWGRFFDHTVAGWLGHPGIEVVPNSTDPGLMDCDDDGFRARHGIGPGPLALCVANYCERKNQKLAARAFREAGVPGTTLVFIGSELGEYGREARRLAEAPGQDASACQVLFLEKLTRAETFAAYKATDLVLLTATAETQPIVLIEAMAAGKPWISTDTGCVDRMEGGVVCRSRAALVSALKELMADPARRSTLSAQGLKAARTKYDSRTCVMKYDTIFRSLLPPEHSRA